MARRSDSIASALFSPIPLRVSEVKRAGLAGEAWNS